MIQKRVDLRFINDRANQKLCELDHEVSEVFRNVGSLDEHHFHCIFSSFGSLEPLKNLTQEEEKNPSFSFLRSQIFRLTPYFLKTSLKS